MFTGLIQGKGGVRPLDEDRFAVLMDTTATGFGDLAYGDSIAVDGVCLTVEAILADGFVATASPETLGRTTLGRRDRAGTTVNLEPSLRVGSKLGGHFVTGHVDGVGQLLAARQDERSWSLRFGIVPEFAVSWEQQVARYLIPKGSIAVNGISLTVAECDPEGRWFEVAVIPATYAETNLSDLALQAWVNLESDLLGKYVDKLLGNRSMQEQLSLSFLAEHGYI